ncbi:MAG: ATP-dependent zinc metalloprotease FtsH [bacterium]
MKNLVKNFLILLVIFLVIAGLFSILSKNDPLAGAATEIKKSNIGEMIQNINNDKVAKIVEKDEKLEIYLKDGSKEEIVKTPQESFGDIVKNYSIDSAKIANIDISREEKSAMMIAASAVLPFLLPFLLIVLFIWLMMRQVQGANSKALMFGQSGAKKAEKKDGKNKITFKDVAGNKEAKEELLEVVEFLKDAKKFTDIGARIPKGVLLIGAPGTGKTLMARAVAGEADVPFFHISGSEFVEMFVGVGASRVRDLFKCAKKEAPCIIFIDEMDAVGRRRGAGLGGSHDEREQTLNQILVEMDGFEPNSNVIVLSATNRPDVLDPALLRPGRFDRRVFIDYPDIKDREAILKHHTSNKPLEKNVSLKAVADRTPGFSGADLANLLNEAAILAARRNKHKIGQDEILESVEKVLLGPERKSHILNDKEKNITAYHEAGHALVSHMLPNADPVHKVSIVSRGRAAGYTLKLPTEDKHLHTKSEFVDDLAVLLAGQVAEEEIFNEVTTGASNDLKQATRLAKTIVTQYGMNEKLGSRTFGDMEDLIFLGREIHEQRDYSEKTAELIDNEVFELITNAKKTAKEIINKERRYLEKIVAILLDKETIEKADFEAIFKEDKKVEVAKEEKTSQEATA